MQTPHKGFTIAEISVVIACLGLIAAFVYPNYVNALAKADEHLLAANLNAIRPAMEMYKKNHGSYPAADMNDLGEINTVLGLGLTDYIPSAFYQCTVGPDPARYECRGYAQAGGWYLHVMSTGPWESTSTTAHCDSYWQGLPCPSCSINGGTCPWG